jgi:hypothetical protein
MRLSSTLDRSLSYKEAELVLLKALELDRTFLETAVMSNPLYRDLSALLTVLCSIKVSDASGVNK